MEAQLLVNRIQHRHQIDEDEEQVQVVHLAVRCLLLADVLVQGEEVVVHWQQLVDGEVSTGFSALIHIICCDYCNFLSDPIPEIQFLRKHFLQLNLK